MPTRRVTPDPAWLRELVRDVLPVFLASRLFFVLLTLIIFGARVATGASPIAPLPRATGTVFDLWSRWDALWYDDLARLGYNNRGPNGFTNFAFFPLYPLLTRTVHDAMAMVGRAILGLTFADPFAPSYLWAGMLVANLCFVGALAFFYGFVRLDYGRSVARRAVALLAFFPLSFFLFAAYSEGTFLLCAIAFFYCLRLERWWQAGLWGLLATETRPPGIVLLAPFLLAWAQAHPVVTHALSARLRMAWRGLLAQVRLRLNPPEPARAPAAVLISTLPLDFQPAATGGRTPRRRAGDLGAESKQGKRGLPRGLAALRARDWPAEVRHAVRNGTPALAIPLGLVLFMAFLYIYFGDPLAFSHAQKAWWRTFAPPWETLYISVAWPLGDALRGAFSITDSYALHDVFYEITGLSLTWLAWRRLPRVQGVYLWLIWLVILSSPAMLPKEHPGEPHHDVLMSLPRMMLMMFPLFTYLGLRRRWFPWLIALSLAGLTIYTSMFLTGNWVS